MKGKRRTLAVSGLVLVALLFGFSLSWYQDSLVARSAQDATPHLLLRKLLQLAETPLVDLWITRLSKLAQTEPDLVRQLMSSILPTTDSAAEPTGGSQEQQEPFRLTFPHTANGQFEGIAFVTTVIVISNGGANATGTIFLRQSDGLPMQVTTNLGTGSEFDFTLNSGEILRLETDGQGPILVGWIEVVSDVQVSGSGGFTTFSNGQFQSEVGIGDSVRANKLMVFADATEGKGTGVGICNPSATAAANLTYTLKTLNGTVVASKNDVLGAQNQKAAFLTEIFAGLDLGSFRGVLIIESDLPVAVITLRTRGLNFTSLPAVPEVSGSDEDTLLFARIGDGIFGTLGFQTSIILLNNSDQLVSGTLNIFRDDGEALELTIDGDKKSSFEVSVSAGCALELSTDGSTNPGVVGWIRVASDRPLAGGATFVISNRETGDFVSEVGVPESGLSPKSTLYVREIGPVMTGMAITNPNSVSVTLKLRLVSSNLSDNGQSDSAAQPLSVSEQEVFAEKTQTVAAQSHIGLFVRELFSQVPSVQTGNFEGRLEVEAFLTGVSDEFLTPVTGITLLVRGAFLTTLPLANYVTNFGPTTDFRPATLLAGARPGFCMHLRALGGDLPHETSRMTLDGGQLDLSSVEESERMGDLYSRFFGFLLAGTSFATEIEEDSVSFYPPITDGETDAIPFLGRLSNLPQGGLEFLLVGNSASNATYPVTTASEICFDSELLEFPQASDTPIRVREHYVSQETDEGVVFESTRTSLVFLEEPSGGPRIDSIDSLRVIGGQQIVIQGAGFSADPSANMVTVEGNSRVTADVLQAAQNSLTVRLPDELVTGPARVQVDAAVSNDYQLQVAFAPHVRAEFNSDGSPDAILNLSWCRRSAS